MKQLVRVSPHRWMAAALLLSTFAGCTTDDGPQRYDVSGRVTFGGEPVAYGQIVFEPDAAAGASGPSGHAVIQNGAFTTARDGKGVIGGPHIARINGYARDPKGAADAELARITLFENYTTNVTLDQSASEITLDVPQTAAPQP